MESNVGILSARNPSLIMRDKRTGGESKERDLIH